VRGFTHGEEFAQAARHLFIYERTSVDDYRPERLADCFHLPAQEDSL